MLITRCLVFQKSATGSSFTGGASNKMSIKNTIGRLTLTGLISFGIGSVVTFERYNSYWNQTIFRVQTVDFNILSHTLPTKLSYAILKKQPQEVQRTLDSNYSLFGLVVTDSSGQIIIAYSGKNSRKSQKWKASLDPQQLKNHPYDVLLDPPPVFPQWTYSQPQATERSATSFTNRGRVIGRVYYVRGVRPTFQEDITTFLNNPFSGSSRIQNYATTLAACFGGTFLTWSILEFILYKKRAERRIAEEQARRELELAEEKRLHELAIAQENARHELELAEERRLHELAIAQEKARYESELAEERRLYELAEAEKERQRQLEIAKQREEELVNNNKVLQIQLAERLEQLQSLQQQREQEKSKLIEDASKLHSLNNRLEQEIITLKKSIENLSADAELQQQLNNQLEILQKSLTESLKREKQLEESAKQTQDELAFLDKEIERIKEDTGKHSLNDFEISIFNYLKQYFPDKTVFTQFDVSTGMQTSRFTDFIIVMNNCCIVIEAKSYTGIIESVGYARNTGWTCRAGTRKTYINACWGINPYEQVKTYSDCLYGRISSNFNNLPVYGIVVFPASSTIDNNIKSNIGGFCRVTTLKNLANVIKQIDNQSKFKNNTGLTYQEILQKLTGISDQKTA